MTPKATIRAEGERLLQAFVRAGAVPVEADILQPAGTLLDLYGEDIRARAYVTDDPVKGEMMLRPDFTVPVVQAHMAHGADPARYCYMGEVFRKQEHLGNRASEYLQVGYELFDRAAPEVADAEVFALFRDLLAGLGSAIIPYLTVPFERSAMRRGLLGDTWRLRAQEGRGIAERAVALVVRRPVPASLVLLVAIVLVFSGLLALGPPTQWFN